LPLQPRDMLANLRPIPIPENLEPLRRCHLIVAALYERRAM
jgi:hypothetical protein